MPERERKGVLITGAAGFIGRACVREFLGRGWRVSALVHRGAPGEWATAVEAGDLAVVRASIEEAGELNEALAQARGRLGGGISSLVHCAGRASDIGRDRAFRLANYEGTKNVVACMDRHSIGRLVFISTTDVYGLLDFRAADEDQPLVNNLRNPYPKYKSLAEEVIRSSLAPDRYAILRPAAVWGPGDTTIMPRVLKFLKGTPAIFHFGRWRGQNRWPLCYVRNLATVAVLASEHEEALGKSTNVIDSEVTSIEEYYRILLEIFFPDKGDIRSLALPFWAGWVAGAFSTVLSNLIGMDHPLFDPSLYGLYSVSRNLDFSNRRMLDLFHRAREEPVGRETALAELREWAMASAGGVLKIGRK